METNKKLSMTYFTIGNSDDMDNAIEGLSMFCHSFCMDCAKTIETNDLMFRCSECSFLGEDGTTCLIKVFLNKYATAEQRDRASCMGSRWM